MEFIKFKDAVSKQFTRMKENQLFRTQATKDEMWEKYLSSFPSGSNPMYRERTEHDCNCCKQFIRAVGNIVVIIDNKLVSIWDCKVEDPNYQVVANAMSALVKSKPIENIFLYTEKTAGTDKSFEQIVNGVKTWNHFLMFEKVSRLKLRFDSSKGQLSVEDLWDLPLTSNTGKANLDDIARNLHKQLKNDDDVSFVNKDKKSDATVQLKFDIVKHIIEVRLAENEAAAKARSNAEQKQRLLALVAKKQDENLESMPLEELQKMIDGLN